MKGFKKENFDNYLSVSIDVSLIILLVTNTNNDWNIWNMYLIMSLLSTQIIN